MRRLYTHHPGAGSGSDVYDHRVDSNQSQPGGDYELMLVINRRGDSMACTKIIVIIYRTSEVEQ